jgi:DNA-binding NtrC family response regulator
MNVQDFRLSERSGAGHGGVNIPKPGDGELFAAAQSDACVLLSGKGDAVEALARRIHNLSGWGHGSFVPVDCAWPELTLESRLFGALLDDDAMRAGDQPRPTLSQAGTVFLQEVGRLSAASQIRLADYLGELRAHGGGRRARRRVMASSSEALMDRVNAGTFDARLFYRLNVIHIVV